MKVIKFVLFLCAAALSAMAVSCTKEDAPVDTIIGNSIFVPNVKGESVTVAMNFDSDWEINNESSWFTVSPIKGSAGTVNLTVTVLTENTEIKERETPFTAVYGRYNMEYYVIQDGVKGLYLPVENVGVGVEAQNFTFTVEGNVKYSAVPEADWVTVTGITYDSTFLADGYTYSKYMTSTVRMTVDENGGDLRECRVKLVAEEDESITAEFSVRQMGNLSADFSKDFKRKSIVLRFTGTWCGWCPYMDAALEQAMNGYPDRILPVAVHQNSDGALSYSKVSELMSHYSVGALPQARINDYAALEAFSNLAAQQKQFGDVAVEATEKVKSKTALGGYAKLSDNSTIELDLYIAAKEAGNYKAVVYLLEDGNIQKQTYQDSDQGAGYVHDNVLRSHISEDLFGDPVVFEGSDIKHLQFSAPIPTDVVRDVNNLHVVAYITYEGTFTGEVQDVDYVDYGTVIDNATDIRINNITTFEYEE